MNKRTIALFIASAASVPGWAAGEGLRDALKDPVLWIGATACIFLILAFVVVNKAMNVMKEVSLKAQGRWEEVAEEERSAESALLQSLTAAVPVEREDEILTDHDYDGIQELDNRLPPWWLWGFYASIVFAIVYLIRFHVTDYGQSSQEEYAAEMQAAEDRMQQLARSGGIEQIDVENLTVLTDATSLAAGREIFETTCFSCHQKDGGGAAGPNLTDQYWIHGGSIKDVYTTIHDGVPGTAMLPWKRLRPTKVHQVASYVMSLQGTTPANPKAAEGELFIPVPVEEPEAVEEAEADSGQTDETVNSEE